MAGHGQLKTPLKPTLTARRVFRALALDGRSSRGDVVAFAEIVRARKRRLANKTRGYAPVLDPVLREVCARSGRDASEKRLHQMRVIVREGSAVAIIEKDNDSFSSINTDFMYV